MDTGLRRYDTIFVMPSKAGIQESNVTGGKIEKNKTSDIISWIVSASDYSCSTKHF
jgi:hypothetical protein